MTIANLADYSSKAPLQARASDSYCSVLLRAGAATYELAHDLDTLTIDDDATRPNQLEITLNDPFTVLSHAVREGMQLEVDLGSTVEHSLLFKGRIHQIEAEFSQEAVPKLRVVAHDARMDMGLRQRSRRFVDMTLSQVVEQVARAYESSFRVETDVTGNPDFEENGVRQVNQTDLEFLLLLAREFECELVLIDGPQGSTLRFVSSSRLRQSKPAATFYYGRSGGDGTLSSFQPRVDLAHVRLRRAQAAIDATRGEETGVFYRSTSPPLEVRDDYFHDNQAQLSQERAQQVARLQPLLAAAEGSARSFSSAIGEYSFGSTAPFLSNDQKAAWERQEITQGLLGMSATAAVDGPLFLQPAQVIRVENVGARFSGDWYILKVRHVLDREGRRTEFECER